MTSVTRWRRGDTEFASRNVVADSGQTMLFSYLSAILLVGLVAATLVTLAGLAVREGARRGARGLL